MELMIYWILGAMLVLGIIFLAAPISLRYDSTVQWFQVHWLGLTFTRRPGAKKPEKIRKKIRPKARKKQWIKGPALAARLWGQRDLVKELLVRACRFLLELYRTLVFKECEAAVCLPDPMLNGLLYGILINTPLPQAGLSVNFEQRNFAKIRVTVYPYRVALKTVVLLFHLPYLRMIRLARDLKSQPNRR